MARTPQLDLPLVMPAQAQKHVTVNEALTRLDVATQLNVLSAEETAPPGSPSDGDSYVVPDGASGAWFGRDQQVAFYSNGGWVFLEPRAGWRAWDASRGGHLLFDGTAWIADALAVSAGGAALTGRVLEFDHDVTPGPSNATTVEIPAFAQVLGVTGRVVEAVTGAGLTGWRLGVAGSDNRYGSGLGASANSYALGVTGTPVTYYADTPLLISAEGGDFTGGRLRLAISHLLLAPPRAV